MNRLLVIIIFSITSQFLNAQDTIVSCIDTLACLVGDMQFTYDSDADSIADKILWLSIEGDTISMERRLILTGSDTLVIVRTLPEPNDTLFVDTLKYSIRSTPLPLVDIPQTACYQEGIPITLIDRALYDPLITIRNIQINPSAQYEENGDTIEVFLGNGDTSSVVWTYSTDGCAVSQDTTFEIESYFSPIIQYSSVDACFGDSTMLINTSVVSDSTRYEIKISDELVSNSADNILFKIPDNGGSEQVIVFLKNEFCVDRDTFLINGLLTPTATFTASTTCENERLIVNNMSIEMQAGANVILALNGNELNFLAEDRFVYPDTLADGQYNANLILRNPNGCADTTSIDVKIDSVTYVSYQGLGDSYCEDQDTVMLRASVAGGSWIGVDLLDLGAGQARFTPSSAQSNVSIGYSFTNTLGCTDTYFDSVLNVYPKPTVLMLGLEDDYCLNDERSLISSNQINGSFQYKLTQGGLLVDEVNTETYEFNPSQPGFFNLIHRYIDNNGCYDEDSKSIEVFSLPEIDLDDDILLLEPGGTLLLNNLQNDEVNVVYEWSTRAVNSSTTVSQPGIYSLQAFNVVTGCMNRDSIEVALDPAEAIKLIEYSIFPNPSTDFVSVSFDRQITGMEVVNVGTGERITLEGQSVFNTDTNGQVQLNFVNADRGYYCLLVPGIGSFLIVII